MVTQVQLSDHLGISTTVISDLTSRGILEKNGKRGYDLEKCRLSYLGHLRDIASNRLKDGDLDLGAERARLAKEQADAKEMENAVERGDLVYIEHIVKQFESQLGKCKTKLLAVPTKVAAEAHAAASVKEVQEIIESAVLEALSELVGYDKEAASGEVEAAA